MTINPIRSENINQVQPTPNVNKLNEDLLKIGDKSDLNQKRTDKLEISQDAIRLQTVQNRMDSGFYNKVDTIRSTAASINRSFPKGS